MSLLSTNVLRTATYMGGSSNDSHFDIVAIGEENSVTVPAGMVGMVQTNAPFALVDDFWNRPSNIARVGSCESFAYRVDTDQDCDDIPYPATRTVSDQARENDTEGLTLSDMDPIMYKDMPMRTIFKALTASEIRQRCQP